MDALEAEYSFLAPTWKLPTVATPSMYADTYSKPLTRGNTDLVTWNNTMHNSGYIPSVVTRRNNKGAVSRKNPPVRQPLIYDSLSKSMEELQVDQNNSPSPLNQRRRVQIVDHRQTPSTDHYSDSELIDTQHSAQSKSKAKVKIEFTENIRQTSSTKPNVYEQLHSQAVPDPGSYVHAYKSQQRRSQKRTNGKAVFDEYKNFAQNGGFGPAFLPSDFQTYQEKLETEKKRKSYSKLVRETNQYKIEEQKRHQNNGGQQQQQQQRSGPLSYARHRPSEPIRTHFLSAQEVREFERRIKREHDANCKCSLHAKPLNSSDYS